MRTSLLVAAALTLASCRQEEVTRAQVPKSTDDAPAAAPAMGLGAGSDMPAAPAEGRLRWTLPAGWKETAGSGMRIATLTPPGAGKAEATVVALPGDSGGELANVNRWRGQIGLGATDEKGMAEAKTTVQTGVGPASVYTFTSGGASKSRLVAAVVQHDGTSWFIKLMGEDEAVKKANGSFVALIKSLTH